MKHKIAIICCYYGKLPAIYPYWLASCKNNPDFTFFLVSDIKNTELNGSGNVIQLRYSMKQLKEKAEKSLGFRISMETPYKLCDFKAMYGVLFSEELKEFDFWGHCDMDLIFGNLSEFITDAVLEKYKKIYKFGHLSLFRNSTQMNNLYQKKGGAFTYDIVYKRPEFFSFDEYRGMPSICKKNGIEIYDHEDMADITMERTRLYMNRQQNSQHQIFAYRDKHVYRYRLTEEGEIACDKYVYIHFKNRKFDFSASPHENYYILPASFAPITGDEIISPSELKKVDGYVSDEQDECDRKKYGKGRIRAFLKMKPMEKYYYLKQRFF